MIFNTRTLRLSLILATALAVASPVFAGDWNKKDGSGMKQGYWVVTADMLGERAYPSGAKIEEGQYKDDRREGVWKKYFPSGLLRSEITYSNGKPSGYYAIYYTNGNLEEQGSWYDEKNVGEFKRFYDNGKLQHHFYFDERGKRYGFQYYFHENGNPALVVDIKNGVESGSYKRYNADGILAEEKLFENGKVKPGTTKVYQSPKPAEIKVDAHNPNIGKESVSPIKEKTNAALPFQQNGYNTLYDVNGNITQCGEFKNGKLYNGKCYRYNSSGILVKIDLYRKGKFIGTGASDDGN